MDTIGSIFATNKKKEEEGVWFKGPKGTEYLIARQGNKAFVKLAAELTKPHRRMIEKGLADGELLTGITAEVTARTILLDWRGVRGEDGKPVAYTPEEGKRQLLAYPDFADFVSGCSRDVAAYQDEEFKAASGN